jgi:hypothetical protein
LALRAASSTQLPDESLRLHTSARARRPAHAVDDVGHVGAPHLAATRTGTTPPRQFIAATPTPLSVLANSIPAMAVPCQLLSCGTQPE